MIEGATDVVFHGNPWRCYGYCHMD